MPPPADLLALAKTATDDFYALLSLPTDAPTTAITRAYRKTSIKYHPDKNPDNASAAETFIRLGLARDILLDNELREVYDSAQAARKQRELVDGMLERGRRMMKEDLERREAESRVDAGLRKRKRAEEMDEVEKREEEIRRLAEDGKRRRREAQERRERERVSREEGEASFMDDEKDEKSAEQAAPKPGDSAEIDRTVRVRFYREGETASWDKDAVARLFAKYGKVDSVVMGKDKKIRKSGEKHRTCTVAAYVVYTRLDHAHAAVSDAKSDFPLLDSVKWANGEPELNTSTATNGTAPSAPTTPLSTPKKSFRASFGPGVERATGTPLGTPKFSFSPKTPSLEEVTMIRLKQAEKRRLEEQIRRQEAAEEAAS